MKVLRRVSSWRFGLVTVYAAIILSPFLVVVTPAQAAQPIAGPQGPTTPFSSGSWQFIDRTHVGFFGPNGNQIYEVADQNLDTHIDFGVDQSGTSNTPNHVCSIEVTDKLDANAWTQGQPETQILNVSSKGLDQITVKYSIWKGDPTNNCVSQGSYDTTIGALNNFNTSFKWISQGVVEEVDTDTNNQDMVFQDSGNTLDLSIDAPGGVLGGPNELYHRTNQVGQTCADFMVVSTSSFSNDTRFGYYEELDTNKTKFNSRYPGAAGNGCWIVPNHKGSIPGEGDYGNVPLAGTIQIGNYIATRTVPDSTVVTPPAGGGNDCVVSNALSFIVCPIIQIANDFYVHVAEPATLSLLNNGTLSTSDPNVVNAKKVHDQFKNLTNILFVIIFLVIIFSTTLSIGIDNYNVKKMLPRLVVAVILVQFSWVLMQLAFDVSNILAAGISALPIFTLASTGSHIPASSYIVGAGIAGLFGVGVLAAGLLVPFLLVLLALVIGILAVFLTLVLRQYIIIVLVVLAPIAFVAWVLPNTENLFKTWSKMLIRLLLMYPLIVLLFSMAGLFASIHPIINNKLGIDDIVAAIVPIMAFYMVPWTFKWAGGAMAAVGGYVTARGSGLSRKTTEPFRKRWNETNPIYGSQKAANDAAKRQLKAADLYGKNTPVSRLRARMMTGNYGAVGGKRLADAARKAQGEQVQAERQAMTLSMEKLSYDEQQTKLRQIAETTSNVYQRQAAMETMLDKGMVGDKGLAGLAQADMAAGKFTGDAAWTRLQSEKYDDLSTKAGFLVAKGDTMEAKMDDWARNVAPEQLSKTKAGAIQFAKTYTTASTFDPAARTELHRRAGVVLATPRLMQAVKGPEETELRGL